jgi:hypothetical protein
MTGTKTFLERVTVELRDRQGDLLPVYIDVYDNSLSRRWLQQLQRVIDLGLHLEKNYCFMGFPNADRNGAYICDQINRSIDAINQSDLGYQINDRFDITEILAPGPVGDHDPGLKIDQHRLNRLHRYFEDLQGVSNSLSPYYVAADYEVKWHIRQLNLLCHELETWALSWRKAHYLPQWVRPSQLMCWLNAPRFQLCDDDFDLFGIDSMYRDFGGVYVGVNKAIGKHHWEVFNDEGKDSRIGELTTTSLRGQTEAAADFDIEWAQDTRGHPWMHRQLQDFRQWLVDNGFDPDDKNLTIGHPKIAQVDIAGSFGHTNYQSVWEVLGRYLDVYSVKLGESVAYYDYRWSDDNYMAMQIEFLQGKQV